MTVIDVAAPSVQDTELEFVLDQLAAVLPQEINDTLSCNGCNHCS